MIASLCLATDLGMGFPFEHGLLATLSRKVLPKMIHKGAPLLRTKPVDLKRAGVVRVARTVSVEGGRPVLEDGSRPDVANVVWCTGFDNGLSWVDLPVFAKNGEVEHDRGVVGSQQGGGSGLSALATVRLAATPSLRRLRRAGCRRHPGS